METEDGDYEDYFDQFPDDYFNEFDLMKDLSEIFVIPGQNAVEVDKEEEREEASIQAIEGDFIPYEFNVEYERWHNFAEALSTGFNKKGNNSGYTFYEYETDPLPPEPSPKPIQKKDDSQISSVKFAANHYALVQYITMNPEMMTFKVLIYNCGYASSLKVLHSVLCRGGRKMKADLYDPSTYPSLSKGVKDLKCRSVTVKVLEKYPTNPYQYDIIFVPNGFNNLTNEVRDHLRKKLAPGGMITGVYMNASSLRRNIDMVNGITNLSYTETTTINNFFGTEYEDNYFEHEDREIFQEDCTVFDASIRSIFTENGTMTFLPSNHREPVLKPIAKVFHLFFAIKRKIAFPCRDLTMEGFVRHKSNPKLDKMFSDHYDMPITMAHSDLWNYFVPGDAIASCKVDGVPVVSIVDSTGTYYQVDGEVYKGPSKGDQLAPLSRAFVQYEKVGDKLIFRQLNRVELGGLPFQMPFHTLQEMSANSQFFPLRDLFEKMVPEDYPNDGIIIAQRSSLGVQFKDGTGKKKDIFSPRRKLNFSPTVDLKGIRGTVEKVISDGRVVRPRPGKKPNDPTRLKALAGMCNPAELCFMAMASPASVNFHEYENSRKEGREEYFLEYKKPIDVFMADVTSSAEPPDPAKNILRKILQTQQSKVEDFKKFYDGDTDSLDWWDKFVEHQQDPMNVVSTIKIVQEARQAVSSSEDIDIRTQDARIYGSRAVPPPRPKTTLIPWHHFNQAELEEADHYHRCEVCQIAYGHKHPFKGWKHWSTKKLMCSICTRRGLQSTVDPRELPPQYEDGKTVVP